MTEIIIEISLYIIAGVLIGFTFGWFIAKAILKEKFEEKVSSLQNLYKDDLKNVDAMKTELAHYRSSNKDLISDNTSIQLRYEGEKEEYYQNSQSVESLEGFVKTKDKMIEKLTFQLSKEEEKLKVLKSEHNSEIEAFLDERVDITQKYKELLSKLQLMQDKVNKKASQSKNNSWFEKLVPAKS